MLDLTAARIVIVTVACLSQVNAEFIIEVEVHSFRNPMGILSDGNCCDPSNRQPPQCSSECDESFVFCFREFGRTDEDTSEGSCPYGRRVSGVLNAANNDDIMFTIGESFPSGVPNPLAGSGASYPGRIQLAVKVRDIDQSPDDEIDLFLVDTTIPVGTNFSLLPTTHFGIFRNEHTIELNFRLSCMTNSFGPNCTTFCVERDDEQGHYTCGSDGSFVCLRGYQNPATNCTECIPAEGCSPVGGFCNNPDECICLEGYDGESCLIDLDPCGRTAPCRNGSTCMNTGTGDYVCLCPEGFSGRNCEQEEAGLAAGKVAGVITGGIIGGLLLLGVIFLCVVLVKGAVVRRNWKTYTLNDEVSKSKKTNNAPTFTPIVFPGENRAYAGVIGYHVPVAVKQTPSLANNAETNTGGAEEREFDNPLYADSASLSDLYDQRSTEEPAPAPGVSKGQDCEVNSRDQKMSRNESPPVSQADGDYEFDSDFFVNAQTPK